MRSKTMDFDRFWTFLIDFYHFWSCFDMYVHAHGMYMYVYTRPYHTGVGLYTYVHYVHACVHTYMYVHVSYM